MKVGIYCLYNYAVGKRGEPFGMCELHAAEYTPANIPALADGSCRLDKLADSGNIACDDCLREHNKRRRAGTRQAQQ